MGAKQQRSPTLMAPVRSRTGDHEALLKEILRAARRDLSRVEFLGDIAGTLLDFSGCDSVAVRVRKDDRCFRCEATSRPEERSAVRMTRCEQQRKNPLGDGLRRGAAVDEICRMVRCRPLHVQGAAGVRVPTVEVCDRDLILEAH